MLAFACVAAQAQDLITKKNGEDVQAKVLEVNKNDIKYKRWDNLEGPTFTMAKSDILIVRYENGINEVFNNAQTLSDAAMSGYIQPGMRYREYKKYYDPKSYTHQDGDRYSPAVGGLCSFLIPGLGQMVCGEVGRGFGYLGGTIGCSVVMGVGSSLVMSAMADTYEDEGLENGGLVAAGAVMVLAGAAALLAVDICAIVDGVRVAKIKNMYERDIRDMASVSVKLEPYIATTYGMNSNVAAGASLKIRF